MQQMPSSQFTILQTARLPGSSSKICEQPLHSFLQFALTPFLTGIRKIADLKAIQHFKIDEEISNALLDLNETRWQVVQLESVAVLEQVMRSEIRDYQMEEARRSIPALVNITIPDDEAKLVILLVNGVVAPNASYNEAATQQARDLAREEIAPIVKTYAKGETIIAAAGSLPLFILKHSRRLAFLREKTAGRLLDYNHCFWQFYPLSFFSISRGPRMKNPNPKIALATSILFVLIIGGLQIMIRSHHSAIHLPLRPCQCSWQLL